MYFKNKMKKKIIYFQYRILTFKNKKKSSSLFLKIHKWIIDEQNETRLLLYKWPALVNRCYLDGEHDTDWESVMLAQYFLRWSQCTPYLLSYAPFGCSPILIQENNSIFKLYNCSYIYIRSYFIIDILIFVILLKFFEEYVNYKDIFINWYNLL